MNKEDLIAELQKWEGDQNRSLETLFEQVKPGMFSNSSACNENSVDTKLIMRALAQSSKVIEQSLSGLPPEEAEFNAYCHKMATELEDCESDSFQKFLKQSIRVATKSTMVGRSSRAISRPRGDDTPTILTYDFPAIKENSELESELKEQRKKLLNTK